MCRVSCSCGKTYKVGREYMGRDFRCKACDKLVSVPEADSVMEVTEEAGLLDRVKVDLHSGMQLYALLVALVGGYFLLSRYGGDCIFFYGAVGGAVGCAVAGLLGKNTWLPLLVCNTIGTLAAFDRMVFQGATTAAGSGSASLGWAVVCIALVAAQVFTLLKRR